MIRRPSNVPVSDPIWHLYVRTENVLTLLSEEKITVREADKRVRAIIDDYEVDTTPSNPFPTGPNSIDGVMLP